MDHRKALPRATVLDFPGMQCTLGEEVGRGSNAIVYTGWYPDLLNPLQRHLILIKELFPYHAQGAIYRDERGHIVCTAEGEQTLREHRRSFEAGNGAHLALLERHPDRIGANLNTFEENDTLYTVLGFTGGRSLEQEYALAATDLRLLCTRMLSLLDALEAFHESGLAHLDIAPDNVLLIGRGEAERVILIDYNSAHPLDAAPGADALPFSIKQGYTPPEIRNGRLSRVCAASDLYSVAAVFYRCLTAEPLSAFAMIRPAPPDVSECPCLRNQPETVRMWVNAVLARGLQTLPHRRYRSVGEMREALRELILRIDGRGITHWALWESGRRNVARAISENPSLAFLRAEESLFPVRGEWEGGQSAPIEDCIAAMANPGGENALLTAGGGMGKTTAMLHAAVSHARHYAPDLPAILYVPLYGWREGQGEYICERILQALRFEEQTRSFADARHALWQLMDAPLATREGERPVVLLFLDGLNEVAGSARGLLAEIMELSRKRGVRLLVSARTQESALPFCSLRLCALSDEDVQGILARNGLLPPESPEMRELLRAPLLLSAFVQSAQIEGQQVVFNTREELLEVYFNALRAKEIAQMPQDDPQRWQLEAACACVLPAIAAQMEKSPGALSDRQLLDTVAKCYRLLKGRAIKALFPQWIGRVAAIRNGATDVEEWYGQVVHELLWKRMGLLARDEAGHYQICHQIIAQYLLKIYRENASRTRRRRVRRIACALAASAVLCAASVFVYRQYVLPQPYSEVYAQTVFINALGGYLGADSQCESIRSLLECAMQNPEDYEREYQSYCSCVEYQSLGESAELTISRLKAMLDTGSVMPWSGKPMQADRCEELLALRESREEEYALFSQVLTFLMRDERANGLYAQSYMPRLSELIEIDAEIAALLYQIVCEPHCCGVYADGSPTAENYEALLAGATFLNAYLSDVIDQAVLKRNLVALEGERSDALNALYGCGAIAFYELEGER